jgi:hypothetical protein
MPVVSQKVLWFPSRMLSAGKRGSLEVATGTLAPFS